jgi:hypothetical protein
MSQAYRSKPDMKRLSGALDKVALMLEAKASHAAAPDALD